MTCDNNQWNNHTQVILINSSLLINNVDVSNKSHSRNSINGLLNTCLLVESNKQGLLWQHFNTFSVLLCPFQYLFLRLVKSIEEILTKFADDPQLREDGKLIDV